MVRVRGISQFAVCTNGVQSLVSPILFLVASSPYLITLTWGLGIQHPHHLYNIDV